MAQRIDPQDVPVIGIDKHLPAVPPSRLTAAALRRRFIHPPDWQPETRAEPRLVDRAPAHASVLIGIVQRDEPTVLLTRRAAHLNDHPGQIAFPGGRAEPEDADAAATALREAEEEVGLPSSQVEVLGSLPLYTTTSGFIVTPVIGLVTPGFAIVSDPTEVDEVFEVPLAFLMDPAHHQRHEVVMGDVRRQFLSMPWQEGGRRYMVWGATAAMLRNLYRFLDA